MGWHNVTVTASPTSAEAVETLMWTLGAVSVTVEDAGDTPRLQSGIESLPLWETPRVVALVEDDVDRDAFVTALRAAGHEVTAVDRLEDRDWERAWMDRFQPMAFGDRLWVLPDGFELPAEAGSDAVVLHLDPGLAFGTGTHPTTAMCLDWLASRSLAGQRVLDYGCGSGILAVAAALLGCTSVLGIDNDSQALTATRQNAAANGVDVLTALHGERNEPRPAAADVLMANILAGTLIDLAPLLSTSLAPGGRLLLSGIMESQAEWVMAAYRPDFVFVEPVVTQEGWVLLEAARP